MKSDIECNLIKDLLPIYRDGLASEESIRLIEDHLKQCNECTDVFRKIKSNGNKENYKNNSISISIKRKIIVLFISAIIIGLILTSISVFCIFNRNPMSFNSIFDWVEIFSLSVGMYFIPMIAIFISIIYYKTSYIKKNDYWPIVICTFLSAGMLTLTGFLIWNFISIIII